MEYVFGRIKDRVAQLFGLLFLSQTVIFFYALTLFSNLRFPETLQSLSANKDAKASVSLEKLAVEGVKEEERDAQRTVLHRVKSKETLSRIWSHYGAPSSGAARAAEAIKVAGYTGGALRAGEEIELSFSMDGDLTDLKKRLPDGRTLVVQGNSVDGYEAALVKADTYEIERTISGTILSSLSNSAEELGVPWQVVDEFVDLFSSRLEFSRDIQPGDTFTVTYGETKVKGSDQILSTGKIKTASIMKGGAMLAAVSYAGKDGKVHYFDEKGNALGSYFLRYPLKFSRISSSFTWARFHPVQQRYKPHMGVDFAAPVGTSVRSVGDGTVVEAGYHPEAGNWVKIQHGSRWSTAYLHLSRIALGLRRGSTVSRAQIIGAVGSTGVSTGPHLHFALYDRGQYVDPMKANLPSLSDSSTKIPTNVLLAALNTLQKQHETTALAQAATGRSMKRG